jgi:hypothetical protein
VCDNRNISYFLHEMRPLNLAQRYSLEMAFERGSTILQLTDYYLIVREWEENANK